LQIESNGDFTFTLLDQIDHLPNVPANDDGQQLTIDFSSAIQFTDFDDDTITLNGGFTIVIEDDVAELAGTQVAATVLEDGLSLGTGDFSEGNRESGETLGSDEASGVTGSLTTLYHTGADAPLSFTLSTTTSGLPVLFSHGEQLTYTVDGNVLTAS